jgi:hypothetical protein
MPIQVIITGNDANEIMSHVASFIGLRGLQNQAQEPITAQLQQGNGTIGEAAATTTEAPPKKRAGRPKKEAAPEPEQETEVETAAQDDADEQQVASTPATVDDVRAVLTDAYVKRYGMEATQKDILKLYAMRFPDGSVTKASDIPDGMHAQVIEDIEEMAAKNPFKRARVDQL